MGILISNKRASKTYTLAIVGEVTFDCEGRCVIDDQEVCLNMFDYLQTNGESLDLSIELDDNDAWRNQVTNSIEKLTLQEAREFAAENNFVENEWATLNTKALRKYLIQQIVQ